MEISKICEATGFEKSELQSKYRYKELVWARYFVFEYLRNTKGWRESRIGEELRRDRTSVIHGLKYIREKKSDKEFQACRGEFLKRIYNKKEDLPHKIT
jgi:chromosomal replication initiation ATPase DnaA